VNNQEILDNAPEGATHVEEGSNLYIKVTETDLLPHFDEWWIFECGEWAVNDSYNILLMRSLADIKRIAELKEALDKLIERASLCDSWENFPSDWLDEAYKSLRKGGAK
jgi:hypothetical protein